MLRARVPREIDKVYADGNYLDVLWGYHNGWHETLYSIPHALLADGQLDIWLDIDAGAVEDRWAVTIDWSRMVVFVLA